MTGLPEIERWVTRDGGVTFTHTAVTSASTQHNVRPIAVRGSTGGPVGVLWMGGGAYQSYTSFSTAIKGSPDPNTVRQVTRLRSSITPSTVSAGQTVVVGGRLVVDDTGATIPSEPLELWVRPAGRTDWAKLADGITDTAGLMQWTRSPTSDADYEVRYLGDAVHLPAVSPRVRVDLR